MAQQPDPPLMAPRPASLALGLLLAGCVQTKLAVEHPALLTAEITNAAILQGTLQKALARPVTLAGDALTRESTLVIGTTPARVDGRRIDGRETREAAVEDRFTLVRVRNACVLRRENTGERYELAGADCRVP